MRVYNKGKIIPVQWVTWATLCDKLTYVDWSKDTHIAEWPDRVKKEQEAAFRKLLDFAGENDSNNQLIA